MAIPVVTEEQSRAAYSSSSPHLVVYVPQSTEATMSYTAVLATCIPEEGFPPACSG